MLILLVVVNIFLFNSLTSHLANNNSHVYSGMEERYIARVCNKLPISNHAIADVIILDEASMVPSFALHAINR